MLICSIFSLFSLCSFPLDLEKREGEKEREREKENKHVHVPPFFRGNKRVPQMIKSRARTSQDGPCAANTWPRCQPQRLKSGRDPGRQASTPCPANHASVTTRDHPYRLQSAAKHQDASHPYQCHYPFQSSGQNP